MGMARKTLSVSAVALLALLATGISLATVTRHLLKPVSSRMKQVFVRPALEAVLVAAAERPPSNEGSPSRVARPSLGDLRRSFVTMP
jgi:hypothetical protein